MNKGIMPTALLAVFLFEPVMAETIQVPSIIVSANRSTLAEVKHNSNIVIINREEIRNSGAKSLAEVLKGQPGVHVRDPFGDGGNATIDMRGFGANANANTVITVDGRKLNFASDSGTVYLNKIDLDNIEQIEIVPGSSGVLFGNMAVGGVINIVTRTAQVDAASVSFAGGSYNQFSQKLRVDRRFSDNWHFTGFASNRDADNYRDNNESNTGLLSLRLNNIFEKGSFYTEFQHLDDFQKTPGSLFLDEIDVDRKQSAAVYANDYQDLVSDDMRIGLKSKLNDAWLLEVDGHWQNDDRKFISSFRAFGPGTVSTQDRETINFNPRIIAEYGSSQTTIGLDYQSTDYLLVSAFGSQPVDQLIWAIYLQSIVDINKDLSATVGIRHAEIENDLASAQLDDDVTIGAFALNYRLSDSWKMFAKADQNYRFARVDEHTNPVFGQPVGLENQTGISYELGAQFENDNILTGFQLYQLDLEDEISFDASGYANINLDKTRRQGVSLFAQWFVNDSWLTGFNYDFVDSEITAGPFNGNRIPLVPENRMRLFAEYSVNENWNMNLDAVYTDNQVYGADYSNDYPELDGYTVLNFSSRYQVDQWVWRFRVNNLLDAEYSESGSIGNDFLSHDLCVSDGFGGFNCPAEFTSPERNVWLGLEVNL